MTVEMPRRVKGLIPDSAGIVVEVDVLWFSVEHDLDGHCFIDAGEQSVERVVGIGDTIWPALFSRVMVAKHEIYVPAMDAAAILFHAFGGAEGYIAKYEQDIVFADSFIDAVNDCRIHFLDCGERPIAETTDVIVAKMELKVRSKKFLRTKPPFAFIIH